MSSTQYHVLFPKHVIIGGVEVSHEALVDHFLNTAKPFQTRAAARSGLKIQDAIEAAKKANKWFYTLEAEEWKLLRQVAESDETELPTLSRQKTDKAGNPIGEPEQINIGVVQYIPLIDPVGLATNTEPAKPAWFVEPASEPSPEKPTDTSAAA